MESIIAAADNYQFYFNELDKTPEIKEFKGKKAGFKEVIHQFIDAGGHKDALKGQLAASVNPSGTDRIEKKVKRFFGKHTPQPSEESQSPRDLLPVIQNAAAKLVASYATIDTMMWETADRSFSYRDFRASKESFVKPLKKYTVEELDQVKEILKGAGLTEKTINKVGTIQKKVAKKASTKITTRE